MERVTTAKMAHTRISLGLKWPEQHSHTTAMYIVSENGSKKSFTDSSFSNGWGGVRGDTAFNCFIQIFFTFCMIIKVEHDNYIWRTIITLSFSITHNPSHLTISCNSRLLVPKKVYIIWLVLWCRIRSLAGSFQVQPWVFIIHCA